MKVKLLTSIAGPMHSYGYGEEVDLPDGDARRMIERGQAQPVRQQAVETTDCSAPAETTAARAPRKRAGKRKPGDAA